MMKFSISSLQIAIVLLSNAAIILFAAVTCRCEDNLLPAKSQSAYQKEYHHIKFGEDDEMNPLTQIETQKHNYDNSKFEKCLFSHLMFSECSFRNAVFADCTFWNFDFDDTCDLTDAVFINVKGFYINKKHLVQTASYKHKQMRHIEFRWDHIPKYQDYSGIDFTGVDFTGSVLHFVKDGCRFTNAIIRDCNLSDGLTIEQLKQTKDYNDKSIRKVILGTKITGIDFSGFDLTGCYFGDICRDKWLDMTGVNLTDAVITDCIFPHTKTRSEYLGRGEDGKSLWKYIDLQKTLTISQIKSTWNYKTGNMTGIVLPKYLQDELDKENESK